MHRNEARANPWLPGLAPRLLWTLDTDGWLLLGFEHIEGRHADVSPGSPDLPRIADVLAGMERDLTPCPSIPLQTLSQRWAALPAWHLLSRNRPEGLDSWTRDNLHRLLDTEASAPDLLAGHTLVHTDLNARNFLIGEGVRVVDWAWPCRAAGWIEVAFSRPASHRRRPHPRRRRAMGHQRACLETGVRHCGHRGHRRRAVGIPVPRHPRRAPATPEHDRTRMGATPAWMSVATRKGRHMIIEAGQVAVVTGAAQGLGRALAAAFVDRGVSVALVDIAQERLRETAEAFTTRGGQVLPVVTDVSDAAAVGALASRTLEHFGRVDVVVNNAGITAPGGRPLWQTDPEDWRRVLGVNLLGVVHGIQAFVPHLMAAGAGHVVNIASLAGLTVMPFASAYCASKHAVVAVSETLRAELGMMGLPIGVTVVCPGYVRTPLTEPLFALLQAGDDAQLAEYLPAGLSAEQVQQVRARLEYGIPTMMEPDVVAERILAAVEADQLYALTHGDFEDVVRRRAERILAALG